MAIISALSCSFITIAIYIVSYSQYGLPVVTVHACMRAGQLTDLATVQLTLWQLLETNMTDKVQSTVYSGKSSLFSLRRAPK